ncbi:Uncharacterised protein [Klebsiella pneumoniae]|uniref:Uncharacterized protein n=1 Tax=Klebsiella pneumoniae TaxID=573 RepID=A0A2X3F1Y8_KLEPN|nr:Uncharacterised protein [Klebsiella pneumoniae]
MPLRQGLKPDAKQFPVMGHIVTADKAHHWLPGGHHRMYRHLRFLLLGIDHRRTGGRSAMDRAAVEDHAVDVTLVQPAVELLFRFPFGEKLGMTNFDAVGEILRQSVEKMP